MNKSLKFRLKMGRPMKDNRRHALIAAAIDYRGPHDDVLTFVFRGTSFDLVSRVFSFLIGKGNGIAKKATVTEEHDIIRRNGKGYWRIAVELSEPNFDFCSLDSMRILIEAGLHRQHPCTVHWLSLDKFLNV